MTQEEKSLLLQDLCARLPYGVKLQKFNEPDSAFELYSFNKESGEIMFYKYRGKALEIADVGRLYRRNILLYKPFLRPMSSMTEEEKKELGNFVAASMFASQNKNSLFQLAREALYVDFFNKFHFDYRRLIEKGLALEAPKGMYDY